MISPACKTLNQESIVAWLIPNCLERFSYTISWEVNDANSIIKFKKLFLSLILIKSDISLSKLMQDNRYKSLMFLALH